MEGEEEDDITYVLRKRRFYLASDAAEEEEEEEEEDGKSTAELATVVEVEDRDAEGSTAKPVGVDNKVDVTRGAGGMQLSDVVTQL